MPNWLDPQAALRQRELSHVAYSLSTSNGGATWTPSSTPTYGTIAKLRLTPAGAGDWDS
ncbi:MAG: hypothetical protein WDO73_06175 [Ignavibacteriota bacterium]